MGGTRIELVTPGL